MKLSRSLVLISLLSLISSCAFFNGRTVDLAVNSNPPGADIFIEGRNYGRTPTVINVEPRKYIVTLTKEGYGSAVFNTETWGTIRTDVNGNKTSDGNRCLLDSISVLFFFNVFTEKCADFKQKEYFINIPRLGAATGQIDNGSMLGIGNNPGSMVDYYYGQDMMNNGGMPAQAANPYANPYAKSLQQ
jgi:hypothetical protein